MCLLQPLFFFNNCNLKNKRNKQNLIYVLNFFGFFSFFFILFVTWPYLDFISFFPAFGFSLTFFIGSNYISKIPIFEYNDLYSKN